MRDYKLYLKDILAAMDSIETGKRLPKLKPEIQKIQKSVG